MLLVGFCWGTRNYVPTTSSTPKLDPALTHLSSCIQVNSWRASCVGTPSCPCQPFVKCLAQRTVPWVPGHRGHSAHTPAQGKTLRANKPGLALSWPTTQEKVGTGTMLYHNIPTVLEYGWITMLYCDIILVHWLGFIRYCPISYYNFAIWMLCPIVSWYLLWCTLFRYSDLNCAITSSQYSYSMMPYHMGISYHNNDLVLCIYCTVCIVI